MVFGNAKISGNMFFGNGSVNNRSGTKCSSDSVVYDGVKTHFFYYAVLVKNSVETTLSIFREKLTLFAAWKKFEKNL